MDNIPEKKVGVIIYMTPNERMLLKAFCMIQGHKSISEYCKDKVLQEPRKRKRVDEKFRAFIEGMERTI